MVWFGGGQGGPGMGLQAGGALAKCIVEVGPNRDRSLQMVVWAWAWMASGAWPRAWRSVRLVALEA